MGPCLLLHRAMNLNVFSYWYLPEILFRGYNSQGGVDRFFRFRYKLMLAVPQTSHSCCHNK